MVDFKSSCSTRSISGLLSDRARRWSRLDALVCLYPFDSSLLASNRGGRVPPFYEFNKFNFFPSYLKLNVVFLA